MLKKLFLIAATASGMLYGQPVPSEAPALPEPIIRHQDDTLTIRVSHTPLRSPQKGLLWTEEHIEWLREKFMNGANPSALDSAPNAPAINLKTLIRDRQAFTVECLFLSGKIPNFILSYSPSPQSFDIALTRGLQGNPLESLVPIENLLKSAVGTASSSSRVTRIVGGVAAVGTLAAGAALLSSGTDVAPQHPADQAAGSAGAPEPLPSALPGVPLIAVVTPPLTAGNPVPQPAHAPTDAAADLADPAAGITPLDLPAPAEPLFPEPLHATDAAPLVAHDPILADVAAPAIGGAGGFLDDEEDAADLLTPQAKLRHAISANSQLEFGDLYQGDLRVFVDANGLNTPENTAALRLGDIPDVVLGALITANRTDLIPNELPSPNEHLDMVTPFSKIAKNFYIGTSALIEYVISTGRTELAEINNLKRECWADSDLTNGNPRETIPYPLPATPRVIITMASPDNASAGPRQFTSNLRPGLNTLTDNINAYYCKCLEAQWIDDFHQIFLPNQANIFQALDTALSTPDQVALIHCNNGAHRSSTTMMLYIKKHCPELSFWRINTFMRGIRNVILSVSAVLKANASDNMMNTAIRHYCTEGRFCQEDARYTSEGATSAAARNGNRPRFQPHGTLPSRLEHCEYRNSAEPAGAAARNTGAPDSGAGAESADAIGEAGAHPVAHQAAQAAVERTGPPAPARGIPPTPAPLPQYQVMINGAPQPVTLYPSIEEALQARRRTQGNPYALVKKDAGSYHLLTLSSGELVRNTEIPLGAATLLPATETPQGSRPRQGDAAAARRDIIHQAATYARQEGAARGRLTGAEARLKAQEIIRSNLCTPQHVVLDRPLSDITNENLLRILKDRALSAKLPTFHTRIDIENHQDRINSYVAGVQPQPQNQIVPGLYLGTQAALAHFATQRDNLDNTRLPDIADLENTWGIGSCKIPSTPSCIITMAPLENKLMRQPANLGWTDFSKNELPLHPEITCFYCPLREHTLQDRGSELPSTGDARSKLECEGDQIEFTKFLENKEPIFTLLDEAIANGETAIVHSLADDQRGLVAIFSYLWERCNSSDAPRSEEVSCYKIWNHILTRRPTAKEWQIAARLEASNAILRAALTHYTRWNWDNTEHRQPSTPTASARATDAPHGGAGAEPVDAIDAAHGPAEAHSVAHQAAQAAVERTDSPVPEATAARTAVGPREGEAAAARRDDARDMLAAHQKTVLKVRKAINDFYGSIDPITGKTFAEAFGDIPDNQLIREIALGNHPERFPTLAKRAHAHLSEDAVSDLYIEATHLLQNEIIPGLYLGKKDALQCLCTKPDNFRARFCVPPEDLEHTDAINRLGVGTWVMDNVPSALITMANPIGFFSEVAEDDAIRDEKRAVERARNKWFTDLNLKEFANNLPSSDAPSILPSIFYCPLREIKPTDRGTDEIWKISNFRKSHPNRSEFQAHGDAEQFGLFSSPERKETIFRILSGKLGNDEIAMVHCNSGQHRSFTAVFAFLLELYNEGLPENEQISCFKIWAYLLTKRPNVLEWANTSILNADNAVFRAALAHYTKTEWPSIEEIEAAQASESTRLGNVAAGGAGAPETDIPHAAGTISEAAAARGRNPEAAPQEQRLTGRAARAEARNIILSNLCMPDPIDLGDSWGTVSDIRDEDLFKIINNPQLVEKLPTFNTKTKDLPNSQQREVVEVYQDEIPQNEVMPFLFLGGQTRLESLAKEGEDSLDFEASAMQRNMGIGTPVMRNESLTTIITMAFPGWINNPSLEEIERSKWFTDLKWNSFNRNTLSGKQCFYCPLLEIAPKDRGYNFSALPAAEKAKFTRQGDQVEFKKFLNCKGTIFEMLIEAIANKETALVHCVSGKHRSLAAIFSFIWELCNLDLDGNPVLAANKISCYKIWNHILTRRPNVTQWIDEKALEGSNAIFRAALTHYTGKNWDGTDYIPESSEAPSPHAPAAHDGAPMPAVAALVVRQALGAAAGGAGASSAEPAPAAPAYTEAAGGAGRDPDAAPRPRTGSRSRSASPSRRDAAAASSYNPLSDERNHIEIRDGNRFINGLREDVWRAMNAELEAFDFEANGISKEMSDNELCAQLAISNRLDRAVPYLNRQAYTDFSRILGNLYLGNNTYTNKALLEGNIDCSFKPDVVIFLANITQRIESLTTTAQKALLGYYKGIKRLPDEEETDIPEISAKINPIVAEYTNSKRWNTIAEFLNQKTDVDPDIRQTFNEGIEVGIDDSLNDLKQLRQTLLIFAAGSSEDVKKSITTRDTTFINFPLTEVAGDTFALLPPDILHSLLSEITNTLNDGKKILVHCVDGRNRSAGLLFYHLSQTFRHQSLHRINCFMRAQRLEIHSLHQAIRAYQPGETVSMLAGATLQALRDRRLRE